MKRNIVALAWFVSAAQCGGLSDFRDGDAAVGQADRGDGAVDGGMNGGHAAVQGAAGGQTFSPHGAIGLINHLQTSDPSVPNLVTLAIPANFDLTCEQFKQDGMMNITHPNEAVLVIYVLQAGSSPLVPGAYPVASPSTDAGAMTASGFYSVTDSKCSRTFQESFTAGSVMVTAVDTVSITGTFHLTFSNGDDLDGQFFAPLCYTFGPEPGGIVPRSPTCVH